MPDEIEIEERVAAAMRAEFAGDDRRIRHAQQVLEYAQELLRSEEADTRVVVTAALLHDIGIPEAERRHGSSAARFQELEGPPVARHIMERLGLDDAVIEHVCRIIANHHSARDIDTPEFRVIWDADWLVNLPGESAQRSPADLGELIQRLFRTSAGRAKARELFIKG